jgi:hypothetical protein
LRARGAELPLAGFVVAFAFRNNRVGVAGRNRPAEEGSGRRKASGAREEPSSLI